jgi:hypothetical protein
MTKAASVGGLFHIRGAHIPASVPAQHVSGVLSLFRPAKHVDSAITQALVPRMEDLSAKLEKLLIEAEDCDLIGRLATDLNKRELFKRLAVDLRAMAHDIEAMMISGRIPKNPSPNRPKINTVRNRT